MTECARDAINYVSGIIVEIKRRGYGLVIGGFYTVSWVNVSATQGAFMRTWGSNLVWDLGVKVVECVPGNFS